MIKYMERVEEQAEKGRGKSQRRREREGEGRREEKRGEMSNINTISV